MGENQEHRQEPSTADSSGREILSFVDELARIGSRLDNIERGQARIERRQDRMEAQLAAIAAALVRRISDGVALSLWGMSVTLGTIRDLYSRAAQSGLMFDRPEVERLPIASPLTNRCETALVVGTANTTVYVRDKGVVMTEPTVISFNVVNGVRKFGAIGEEAETLMRKGKAQAGRLMRGGAILDVIGAKRFLAKVLMQARKAGGFRRRAVVVSVPISATNAEREILYQAVAAAGARHVFLMDEPLAAALGQGLPVTEPQGSMMVLIGEGTTQAAIFSMGQITDSWSGKVGCADMDEALVSYLRRRHDLLIGDATAGRIRKQVGLAMPPGDGAGMTVYIKGRDSRTHRPKNIDTNQAEIQEALAPYVDYIVEGVRSLLARIAPELAADLVGQGIYIAGGGALLNGLDQALRSATGLPVTLAEDALLASAIGAGRALDDPNLRGLAFEYRRG